MKPAREAGFTLLEVMVAFVVLAIALGLLLGMLSRGLKQVAQAASETEASLHAQSLLDALGTLEPIEPGVRDGQFDRGRYRWRLDVAEVEDPAPPELSEAEIAALPIEGLGAPVLYRVVLEVEWGARAPAQRLRYATLRLRTPTPDALGLSGATP